MCHSVNDDTSSEVGAGSMMQASYLSLRTCVSKHMHANMHPSHVLKHLSILLHVQYSLVGGENKNKSIRSDHARGG